MDIRNYFSPTGKTGAAKSSKPSPEKTHKESKSKRKRQVIVSDSESEGEVKKTATPKKKSKTNADTKLKQQPEAKKSTKPTDFFGAKPVTSGSTKATSSSKLYDLKTSIKEKTPSKDKHKKDKKKSKESKDSSKAGKGKEKSIPRVADLDEIKIKQPEITEIDDDWGDIDDESFCQLVEMDEKHDDEKFNAVLEQLDNETKPLSSIAPNKNTTAPRKKTDEESENTTPPSRVKTPTKKPKHEVERNKSPPTRIKPKIKPEKSPGKSPGKLEKPPTGKQSVVGKTFIFTGNMDSLERDDGKKLITELGGRVVSAVSGKVNYLVAGDEPGVSKMAKADKLPHCKIINEEEFFDLIGRDRNDPFNDPDKQPIVDIKKSSSPVKPSKPSTPQKFSERLLSKMSSKTTPIKFTASPRKTVNTELKLNANNTLMWVDKYKPSTMKQIIGQGGDRSNGKKLLNWLKDWKRHRQVGTKPVSRFGGFGGGDPSGAGFRAALLSGPPGIGKTTTATLVCKEAGFSYFELNASDARSKSVLQNQVAQALGNKTLVNFTNKGESYTSSNHCIIMDEVDGMAGNEDRGGIQELIQLIKNSHIPVICICNDRQSKKIRSLSNHCFDLRFYKPKTDQIKAAMMSVCFKEGINIDSGSLTQIIEMSNLDIRQCLHNLSVWSAENKNLNNSNIQATKKDFKLDVFTTCRLALTDSSETNKMSLKEKSDLFFYDYSLHPLIVQENYIHVKPHRAKTPCDYTRTMMKASLEIASGDMVSSAIRMEKWGLLPMQALFSSVFPGETLKGHLTSQISFPAWLGKFSSTNKYRRINGELTQHMGLATSGSNRDILLDYLPALRTKLTQPLIKHGNEGVQDVVNIMETYELLKDDYDNVLEITQWSRSKDLKAMIESKTKAALTRTYNKSTHKLHYSIDNVTGGKKRKGTTVEHDDEDESSDDEQRQLDAMKKAAAAAKKTKAPVKKPRATKSTVASKSTKPTTSKGKKK